MSAFIATVTSPHARPLCVPPSICRPARRLQGVHEVRASQLRVGVRHPQPPRRHGPGALVQLQGIRQPVSGAVRSRGMWCGAARCGAVWWSAVVRGASRQPRSGWWVGGAREGRHVLLEARNGAECGRHSMQRSQWAMAWAGARLTGKERQPFSNQRAGTCSMSAQKPLMTRRAGMHALFLFLQHRSQVVGELHRQRELASLHKR
jgi:hypothetical protein